MGSSKCAIVLVRITYAISLRGYFLKARFALLPSRLQLLQEGGACFAGVPAKRKEAREPIP